MINIRVVLTEFGPSNLYLHYITVILLIAEEIAIHDWPICQINLLVSTLMMKKYLLLVASDGEISPNIQPQLLQDKISVLTINIYSFSDVSGFNPKPIDTSVINSLSSPFLFLPCLLKLSPGRLLAILPLVILQLLNTYQSTY